MFRKRNQLTELTICLLGALVTCLSFIIAGLLRYHSYSWLLRAENLQGTLTILVVLHIAAYYFLKVFNGFFTRRPIDELSLSVKFNLILIAGEALISFGLKRDLFVSRLVMGYFFICNTLLFCCVNIIIRYCIKTFRKSDRRRSNLLIVTTTRRRFNQIRERFEDSKETAWNISGVVLIKETHVDNIDGIPVVPLNEDEYLEFATLNVIDEVFIQVDSGQISDDENLIRDMILEFEQMGVVVNLGLDMFNMGVSGERRMYTLEGYNVIAFTSRLFDYRMVVVKRFIDIIGSLVGLVFTGLISIVLIPAIKLDSPGPVIYKQKRVGVNGRVFDFYKFRSMYVDADERKKELMDQNEVEGPMFKMEDDPRITRVGRFIRRTSLDEFPQFFNVLKGDMSLVGTRPPTLDEYQQYSYYQKRRISFRPGITGLWQISGRSDIKDFDEVVKLDLEYIDNWSLMLDFKIILKTIPALFEGKGAR